MSMLRPEMLQVTAQSVGIDSLSDSCIEEMLPEVEFRVRELVQDALKFQRHSKAPSLTPQHINQALKARNLEELYGFPNQSSSVHSGRGINGAPAYHQAETKPSLFYLEDEELQIAELLQVPLPQLPRQPSVNIHWLAVDGVQPYIPENDIVESDKKITRNNEDETSISRKPLVKHALTEEMQLYYTRVTEAMESEDEDLQNAVFSSLARDPGIHQLLPYLSRFVYDQVKASQHDLSLLFSLVRMSRCLLINPHLHVELYLHQLVPAMLTCILGKQLCENPADDHWVLRRHAAQLIAQICERFGDTYLSVQSRIAKTFHKAVTDPNCAFTTQYGALYGMMYLGPLVVESLLFPQLAEYCKRLEPALSSSNPNLVERLEAQSCFGILVHVSGSYFSTTKNLAERSSPASTLSVSTLSDVMQLLYDNFGESLLPYICLHQPRDNLLDLTL